MRETLKLDEGHVTFDEPTHVYTFDGKELTSVTTVLKEFFPFNADEVASTLGQRSYNPMYRGKSKEEILHMWQLKRELGTRVHEFIEDYLNGEFVTITCIRERAMFNFLSRLKFEDVLTEVIVVQPNWGLAGMIDCLIKQNGKWYIWDWKTDKSINTKGFKGEMCTGLLKDFPQCNFTKYRMQLSIYRMILESSRYDIDIAGLKVVHVSEDGLVQDFTIPYEPDVVAEVISEFKKKLK